MGADWFAEVAALTRFIVRELEGFPIGTSRASMKSGVTVWVADEAYNGRAVRTWCTEDPRLHRNIYRTRRERCQAEAKAYADALNAMEPK